MKKLLTTLLLSTAVTAQAAPIMNIFELGIKAGQTAAYDEVGKYNITASVQNEKGTLAMYSAKRKNNPEMAYMFEIYADNDAYQTHIQSPQYRFFLQKSPELLTDHKRKINVEPQYLADKKVEQTAQTINNFVMVEVKPEFNQAFREIVIAEMAQSMKVEQDVLAMYAVTDKEKPTRWYFYEIYASEQAYQQHRQTAHFKDYLKQTADMLQGKEMIEITPAFLMNKGSVQFNTLP
ncbi:MULTISPECIES: putative quinol monooxygenase [Glaesserella]|uniref:Antibiotic biosynthesis monooxygenase n=1 Tax=Glaesserella australis TaxID=2094024 RepID=A0A328C041_9PAST|nr:MULTISPECIES: antibiotic biosynthesis monooxygenase [Glaesserella]AUI66875.1 antibiotic biosynthesis monooxygenase [Glaesserella sp. 15-184]RAL19926.1 antibiotic biosynthesis monooxygenase [Glaesserella australis]